MKPSPGFAEMILDERRRYKEAEGQNSGGSGATGRRNVSSTTGENRNVRLCSLRGALFNKVPEMDDEEIEQALWAANEQFSEPMTEKEMRETVLRPKPNWERHPTLVYPDSDTAIETFKQLYDLRASAGKFYARPSDASTPAVVTEIGDPLGRTVAAWWEDAAVAWNEMVKKRRQEQAEEKAVIKAAEDEKRAAKLAAMTEQEQAEFVSQEQKDLFARATREPAAKSEEDSYAETHPARDKINHCLYHLEVAAARLDPVDLHLRVVDGPGYVVVDLADETGNVVLITADGWSVTDVREVEGVPWFRRNSSMIPQVYPVEVAPADVVATLDKAKGALGMEAPQWRVILSGLIGAFFPSVDRPGWWLTGPSGAGKTTRGRMIAGWVDPVNYLGGSLNLRRDERNARTRAMNDFIVSMDNLTTVTQEESDFWCGLHTGASAQARKLHSDDELLTFTYKRIGLGTSLNMPVGFKSDALRRMLHIEVEASQEHLPLKELWATYDSIKGEVLGALFTVLSGILAHLGKAQGETLPGCPEMSDFALRLWAADLAFGHLVPPEPGGEGLTLYEAYRRHTVEILVAAGLEDPLVLLVLQLMDGKKAGVKYTCSPSVLLTNLRQAAVGMHVDHNQQWFPANEKQLGHRLNDKHNVLESLGITVERGARTSRYLPYVLTRAITVDSPLPPAGNASTDVTDSDNS